MKDKDDKRKNKKRKKISFMQRKRQALKKTQQIRKKITDNNRQIDHLLGENAILYNELIHKMIYLL